MAAAVLTRAAMLVALLASHAAGAADCGPRLDRLQIEALGTQLGRTVAGLSMYSGALRVGGLELASYVVRDATVLHERLGRVALLAEVRDMMLHPGERSFLEFKLSHEASLLKEISTGAGRTLNELASAGGAGASAELAALRDAVRRAEAIFASCDSPM